MNDGGNGGNGGSVQPRKARKATTPKSPGSPSGGGWALVRNSEVLAEEVKLKRLMRLGVMGFEFESTVGMGEMNPGKKTASFDHTVHQTLEDQLQVRCS